MSLYHKKLLFYIASLLCLTILAKAQDDPFDDGPLKRRIQFFNFNSSDYEELEEHELAIYVPDEAGTYPLLIFLTGWSGKDCI